jgi:LPXTG-motif cell wall-anchored protein
MNLKKMLATGAIATACFVAIPASAAFAEGYKTPDGAKVTDNTPAAGQEVTIEVGGFGPHSTVTIELHSDPVVLGTFTADGEGVVRATVRLPEGVSGSHDIVVMGTNALGAPVVANIPVTISAVPTDGSGSGDGEGDGGFLPRTGSNTSTIVTLGGVLIVMGGAATVVTRKRLATVSK